MQLTENQRLKILREKLGLGQKDLAQALDMKQGSISDLERGRASVKKIAKRIESLYNVNSEWLINGEDPMFLVEVQPTTQNKKSIGSQIAIPMYNFPASASAIEMYNDPNEVKVIGHLSIPGATKNSFALPAYGHSMYPTLENGAWGVVRPIEDPTQILWGEIYYIEWGDYRNYKRLLLGDNPDEVILWSDNQAEKIGDRPKYAPVTIKKEQIRRLCLLTDILKKPNY